MKYYVKALLIKRRVVRITVGELVRRREGQDGIIILLSLSEQQRLVRDEAHPALDIFHNIIAVQAAEGLGSCKCCQKNASSF